MTGKEIFDIVFIFCLLGWIPIIAVFSGIAKIVSAFKRNCTGDDGINIDIRHNVDDVDEEE